MNLRGVAPEEDLGKIHSAPIRRQLRQTGFSSSHRRLRRRQLKQPSRLREPLEADMVHNDFEVQLAQMHEDEGRGSRTSFGVPKNL